MFQQRPTGLPQMGGIQQLLAEMMAQRNGGPPPSAPPMQVADALEALKKRFGIGPNSTIRGDKQMREYEEGGAAAAPDPAIEAAVSQARDKDIANNPDVQYWSEYYMRNGDDPRTARAKAVKKLGL